MSWGKIIFFVIFLLAPWINPWISQPSFAQDQILCKKELGFLGPINDFLKSFYSGKISTTQPLWVEWETQKLEEAQTMLKELINEPGLLLSNDVRVFQNEPKQTWRVSAKISPFAVLSIAYNTFTLDMILNPGLRLSLEELESQFNSQNHSHGLFSKVTLYFDQKYFATLERLLQGLQKIIFLSELDVKINPMISKSTSQEVQVTLSGPRILIQTLIKQLDPLRLQE